MLVRHLTFEVGTFDGLPFHLAEHLNTTFGPLDGKLEQLKVAGLGVGGGGHVEVLFDRRLFTVPCFFARSFRYTASYRHGYLDFQMYRGGGRQGL